MIDIQELYHYGMDFTDVPISGYKNLNITNKVKSLATLIALVYNV